MHSPPSSVPAARVADLIVACLVAENVRFVFGIPGEENIWLVDALCRAPSIRYILVRHEQAASFMADIYGRLTGQAGVCSATLGPGAINLLLGTADAHTNSAPLVALAAQGSLARLNKDSHQVIDLAGLFAPVTKWSKTLLTAPQTAEMIHKAFCIAQEERPGAVFLAIPEDIEMLTWPGEITPLRRAPKSQLLAAPTDIDRACESIKSAKAPVVLVGHGLVRARAEKALLAFVEALGAPVATTFLAKGALTDRHPLALGAIGFMRHDRANFVFDEADLIVAIGYEFQEFAPTRINPEGTKRIVCLTSSALDSDNFWQPEVAIRADLGDVLFRLASKMTLKPFLSRTALWARRAHDDEAHGRARDAHFPMRPQRVVADIRQALGDEDIVLVDTGAGKMWFSRLYPTYASNTCLVSNGLSTMAFALPGAIAAHLAFPTKRIVAVNGDGAFVMNSQEIETAVREKIPLVVVILEDKALGLIRWKMDLEMGRHCHIGFQNPDFVRYAEAYGARGILIEKAEAFSLALKRALTSNGVTIIVCPIDASEHERLTTELASLTAPGPDCEVLHPLPRYARK